MSPTGQVFEQLGDEADARARRRADRHGRELPDDEAIGVACGWWPCFRRTSGAYVKLNADGTGTIVTGAQENGSGAVMGLPLLVAEELGMQPEDFSILYQDTDAARGTWARAARRRRSTTAAPWSRPRARCASSCSTRRPSSSRRRGRISSSPPARSASRARPDKSVRDRRPRRRRAPILGKGSGAVPEAPPGAPPRAASAVSGSSRSSRRS